MLLLLIFAAVVLAFLLVGFCPLTRWRLRHIPGPPGLPFIGNILQLSKVGSPAFYATCTAKYGPVFQVWLGRQAMVVITDPDLVKTAGCKIMNRWPFLPSYIKGMHRKLSESGLVSARDEYWSTLRRLWQPAFSPARLSGYIPLMDSCIGKLTARLDKLAVDANGDSARVDIHSELQGMTMQVVGSTAYGVDFKTMEGAGDGGSAGELKVDPVASSAPGTSLSAASSALSPSSGQTLPTYSSSVYGARLAKACKMFFSATALSSLYGRMWLMFPELGIFINWMVAVAPDEAMTMNLKSRDDIMAASQDLIHQWRVANPTNSSQTDAVPTNPVAAGSFLDHLLRGSAKSNLDDVQLSAQAMTFILAGYETTANALAFAIYLIASHPEVEQKLTREIDDWLAALPGGGEPGSTDISVESLTKLKYLEAVFYEAMRLHPPAPGTSRLLDTDMQIGPYKLPKGMGLVLSIHAVHRNRDAWGEDAGEFCPDRFMQGVGIEDPALLPFGAGPRFCVGWRFAVQEAKLALMRLYSQYSFELEPGQVPLNIVSTITSSPRHGVWVKVLPRLKA